MRDVVISGTKDLSEDAVRRAVLVEIGQPLPDTPEHLAETVVRRYQDDGYSFAHATSAFDADTGTLRLTIDEGVIDGVEFQGVAPTMARTFADEFALRSGDVFNRKRAMQALDVMLRQTRGAIRPGRVDVRDSRDASSGREAFDLVDRNGQRVLLVGLREPAGRFRVVPDFGDREDWFTPVDGFVPSLGFGAAVFDHEKYNHAYVSGHFSVKAASERVGYSVGFERPLLGNTKLYLGGELHDLTASDDVWRISSTEASLTAVGARRSFRDYYRRRGLQINSALRIHPHAELLLAWRGERHEPLAVRSDFSVWNGDEPFRPNLAATDGRLRALVIGASVDGTGFDRESLEATYRRHQLETPFGEWLSGPDEQRSASPIWRIDWTSEVSTPGLRSDFDFRRHILSGRTRLVLTEHQELGARVIGGWSGGVLPPQRQFAIGGIGSVHGYEFKEAVGDSVALLNLEYALGWRNKFQVVGFFDAGRVAPRSLQRSAQPAMDGPWLKGVGFGIGIAGARIDFGYKLDAVPSSLQVLLRLGRTF